MTSYYVVIGQDGWGSTPTLFNQWLYDDPYEAEFVAKTAQADCAGEIQYTVHEVEVAPR